MENTGRISHRLIPTARRIIFGKTADESIDAELVHITQVDRAHLVMLSRCRIINSNSAYELLQEIDKLCDCNFAPLREQSASRGLYLLYEDYLIEKLGEQIGGILQTGRSRNDLNATILRLRLRQPYIHLLRETLRLVAILLRRARQFSNVTMPAYTHYQAAIPITYGHYLASIASALERDTESIFEASSDINRFPLGAGAGGGTSFPIDSAYTSSLLGFEELAYNSIDAVASRDLVLRILASITIMGTTLSRLATDLLLWTTNEFGFIELPDQLVGSSSMMPQKRNPFLLEHIQGRSASALGAFVSATTAMHSKPFGNAISVGTEAVSHVWKALQDITDAITLSRLVVANAKPQSQKMLQRSIDGYTSATELANQLVVNSGIPFRKAHYMVGTVIRKAIEMDGVPLQEVVNQLPLIESQLSTVAQLDPTSVVQASVYGGGAGAISLNVCLKTLETKWTQQTQRKQMLVNKWQTAKIALDNAVSQLYNSHQRDLSDRHVS